MYLFKKSLSSSWEVRLHRLFAHICHVPWRAGGLSLWLVELVFYGMDLLVLPDLYEWGCRKVKSSTRPLRAAEIRMARCVFGDSLDYSRIRVDERSRIACKKYRICYVSFYTINLWGPLSPSLLAHELMHVLQYDRIGAVYIPRALLAQRTEMGYDYGGGAALRRCLERKNGTGAFNLEQQASIAEDYFRLQQGMIPRYCTNDPELIPVFKRVLQTLYAG